MHYLMIEQECSSRYASIIEHESRNNTVPRRGLFLEWGISFLVRTFCKRKVPDYYSV